MSFKLYDCEVGIKTASGVNYEFDNVDEVTFEDPEFNRLTRGTNGKDKTGIVYKEGSKEPARATCPILGMSIALKAVLDEGFKKQQRFTFYAISKTTGSSKMLKEAILCQKPQQLTIGESAESLNVILTFESFDSVENMKE